MKNKLGAFSLLEILLVLTILTIVITLVVLAIRPDEVLPEAYATKREAHVKLLDEALRRYATDNDGEYPFSKDDLTEGTHYNICKYQATCTGDFIDFDFLVDNNYLSTIPVDEEYDTGESTSGYSITKDSMSRLTIEADINLD